MKINIENLNRKRKISPGKITKICQVVLKSLKKNNIELNIVFVSNQKIRSLNRKYLKSDRATDVLAFDQGPIKEKTVFKNLGDIIVSSDKAFQNAQLFNVTFFEEIALYVIHGILHLLGYDDVKNKDKIIMKEKENAFLKKVSHIF